MDDAILLYAANQPAASHSFLSTRFASTGVTRRR